MKKNKKKILIISILVIILVFCLNKIITIGTIHYYAGYRYDLEIKKLFIKVTKNEQVQCIKAPCPVHRVKTYYIINKKKYQSTIKKILHEKKEVTVTGRELSSKEEKTLLEIIENK